MMTTANITVRELEGLVNDGFKYNAKTGELTWR